MKLNYWYKTNIEIQKRAINFKKDQLEMDEAFSMSFQ